MLYSFQIGILHKGALLKILGSHEYLHSVIALYVELLFIRCLCIDTACRSLGRRFGIRFSDDVRDYVSGRVFM
jgi:hypothetical protein